MAGSPIERVLTSYLQDVYNLAWRTAAVLRGAADERLLDNPAELFTAFKARAIAAFSSYHQAFNLG